MTKPKTPPTTPEPAVIKDGDAPSGTWPGPGPVPGSGESPLQDLHPAPVDPAASGKAIDPNQLASAGPEGAPQPKPRKEDPGINASVVS